jgi:hypothetical protein
MHIVTLANTSHYTVYQSLYAPACGRPDILPALLMAPPVTVQAAAAGAAPGVGAAAPA